MPPGHGHYQHVSKASAPVRPPGFNNVPPEVHTGIDTSFPGIGEDAGYDFCSSLIWYVVSL